jgi:multicomponent Na+:H+ antiporter subunit C
MAWYLIGALFLVGIWGVVAKHNLIKKVMALSIANSAIVLFFVYYGSRSGNTAPIAGSEERMVDPLPQALMLTAIVVGICVVALALALVYRLYLRHHTLDVRRIEREAWKLDE